MTKSSSKGFTLIELLVVIAIIGLLSTLAVVALNSARQKSRDSKRVADVKQIQTALELYFADNNGYPLGATTAPTLGAGTATTLSSSGWASTVTGTSYMGLVPSAPTPNDGTCSPAQNAYTYVAAETTPVATYNITFCLGAQVGSLGAGLRTADANGIR